LQIAYNTEHGITPLTVGKTRAEIIEQTSVMDFAGWGTESLCRAGHDQPGCRPDCAVHVQARSEKIYRKHQKDMLAAAKDMNFLLSRQTAR
jgi:excinuclease ABC subunit B